MLDEKIEAPSALGPGLRLHSSVSLDTVSSWASSRSSRTALTGLPIGGAKGGADFLRQATQQRRARPSGQHLGDGL
jgi:glutamate dehydrogenase (NADP+)